uniref:Uncharacterized protein n=1 Tax=Octopus bimaculoides TaxID=37653 RepID=A0A0L8FQK3_OCTBM
MMRGKPKRQNKKKGRDRKKGEIQETASTDTLMKTPFLQASQTSTTESKTYFKKKTVTTTTTTIRTAVEFVLVRKTNERLTALITQNENIEREGVICGPKTFRVPESLMMVRMTLETCCCCCCCCWHSVAYDVEGSS